MHFQIAKKAKLNNSKNRLEKFLDNASDEENL